MTQPLPEGWDSLPFEKSVSNVKSTEKLPKKFFLKTGKYPVVSQEKDLINGYSNNNEAVFSVSKPVVVFGDHTKTIKYIDFDFIIGADGVKILEPISKIDSKFFYYYISQLHLRDLGYARHYRLLKQCSVIFPSLTEQRRIAAKLDKIFANIDKAKEQIQKNLQNAKEVFLNGLEYLFTTNTEEWEKYSLADLGDIQTGTTPPTSQKDNFGSYIPFIKPSDFYEDGTLDYDQQGLSDDGLKKSRLIRKKSILMVCIGATITKTGFSDRDVACNQQINALTPTRDNHKFIYYAMIRPSFKQQVLRESPQTTLPIINKTKWSKLTLQVPSLEEQNRIVEQLDNLQIKTQKLQKIYSKKLADLDELKQSILQQAFSGKL